MIELKNIFKVYQTKHNEVEALKGINLTFNDVGFYLIYGASGSGKSTLLSLLAGFEKPSSGTINSSNKLEDLAFIFQDYNLLSNLTVSENLKILGYDDFDIKRVIKKLNLEDKLNTKVNLLSAGEIARVALARAILKNAKVLLLDETISNIDEKNSKFVLEILKDLAKGRLVILISHNYDLVNNYVDYILKLEKGQIVENTCVRDTSNITPSQKKNKLKFNFKSILFYLVKLLNYKKVLTILEVLLITLSLSLFIFSYNYSHLDNKAMIISSLEDNSDYLPYYIKTNNPDKSGIYIGQVVKGKINNLYNEVIPYIEFSLPYTSYMGHLYLTNEVRGLVISDFVSNLCDIGGNSLSLNLSSEAFNLDVTLPYEVYELDKLNKDSILSNIRNNINYYYQNKDYLANNYLVGFLNLDYFKNLLEEYKPTLYLRGFRYYESKETSILKRESFKPYLSLSENDIIMPEGYEVLTDLSNLDMTYISDVYDFLSLYDGYNIVGRSNDDIIYISREFYNKLIALADTYLISGYSGVNTKCSNKSVMYEEILNNGLSFNLEILNTLPSENKSSFVLPLEILGILAVIIAGLFVIYLTLDVSKNNERDILLLKSFGISKFKIYLPFIILNLLKFILTYGISLLVNNIVLRVLNNNYLINSPLIINYNIYHFSGFSYLYSGLITILMLIIVLVIPYIRIVTANIISTIKKYS